MILQSRLLLPWLIMRQNCGGLVKFFENTKTLLIIMWSKPNIHITELPLSSPVEGTYIKLGQGIGETYIQLGEKLNIAAWKFYLLFARVKIDSPWSGLLDQVLFFSRMNQMLCRKNKCMRPVSAQTHIKCPLSIGSTVHVASKRKFGEKKNISICGHPLLEH